MRAHQLGGVRWKAGRAVSLMLWLLVLATCAAVPILQPFADLQQAKLAAEMKYKDDTGGGIVGFIGVAGLTNRYFSRYSRGSASLVVPPAPGTYTANSFTQAAGVTFDTATGEFLKPDWYFGAAPSNRLSALTHHPTTAGQLTSTLAAPMGANPVVQLDVGSSYTGHFTIPAQSGNWTGTLVIRGGVLAGIPTTIDGGSANRVNPTLASSMAKIQSTSTGPAITFSGNADNVWIEGIEVHTNSDSHGLQIGTTSSLTLATRGDLPDKIAIVKCYIHLDAAITGTFNLRGILNEASNFLLIDSYLSGWRSTAADPGAYSCTGYSIGNHDLINNYLEGAGENVNQSGGTDSVLSGTSVWPENIYTARNHIYTPVAWKGVWVVKNKWECKSGKFMTIVGNIFDGCWVSGQVGECWAIKTTNQNNGNPGVEASDLTFRYNMIRNCGALAQLVAAGDTSGPSPRIVNTPLNRVELRDNLAYDISTSVYTGSQALFLQFSNSSNVGTNPHHWYAIHNTCVMVIAPSGGMMVFAGSPLVATRHDNLVMKNNVTNRVTYGVLAQGTAEGTNSMNAVWASYTYSKNCHFGSGSVAKTASYPAGNFFEDTVGAVNFTSVAGDDYMIVASTKYASGGAGAPDDDTPITNPKNNGADIAQVLLYTNLVV